MLFKWTLLITVILFSCRRKASFEEEVKVGAKIKWSNASFDSSIAGDSLFRSLYDSPETIFTYDGPFGKHVCGVAYVNQNDRSDSAWYSTLFRCHAILDSNILSVDIGQSTLLGGFGFVINFADKKFYTSPYWWDDVDRSGWPEPVYTILSQALVLDKVNYSLGDSLYGSVVFNIIEEYNARKRIHRSQAIFRTKVDEPEYIETSGKKVLCSSH